MPIPRNDEVVSLKTIQNDGLPRDSNESLAMTRWLAFLAMAQCIMESEVGSNNDKLFYFYTNGLKSTRCILDSPLYKYSVQKAPLLDEALRDYP